GAGENPDDGSGGAGAVQLRPERSRRHLARREHDAALDAAAAHVEAQYGGLRCQGSREAIGRRAYVPHEDPGPERRVHRGQTEPLSSEWSSPRSRTFESVRSIGRSRASTITSPPSSGRTPASASITTCAYLPPGSRTGFSM